jgi:ankyrin repeat protein
MAEKEGKKGKGMAEKEGKKGKGGKGGKGKNEGPKPQLPELLKSDDFTGQYKEGVVVLRADMPEPYQQAYNNAWNAIRMNKPRQLRLAVERLIETSGGTPAEPAPLDVLCDKAKITFGDLEAKVEHRMGLLAWCGFHCRLDFAQYLVEKGADIDAGSCETGSPLLQMMVLHDARPGAGTLSIDTLKFFTEDHPSVLSRIISTADQPITLCKATVLTVALHMKRVDIAQYLFTEHKLHPVYCGSRDYPPVFLEYIEYGTFEFIPWLFTEGYDSRDEIVQFTDEVFRPEVQGAWQVEGGASPRAGSLAEAAARSDRSVAHAMLLCANRRGINMLTKKRPDLVEAVDSRGRTALYIAAEVGFQKPVNILSDKCASLINKRDKAGVLPLMAAAKAGHKGAVNRLLYHMLKGDALSTSPAVAEEIKHSSLSALSYGYHTYFEALHSEKVCCYEVPALNLTLDDAGNTAAHIAALRGREDTFKALLPAATERMITVLTRRNGQGKTPLQLAVDKGHSGLFGALPAKQTEFREAWKVYNDALLLYACVHGDVETVAAIMQLNSSAQTQR